MHSPRYVSPMSTLPSVLPRTSSMHPPYPAAGRLHLDTLWWTALAETSERGIYRRAYRARSSRLPSLPQASRSYTPFAPAASTRSLLMPTEQGRSTPSPLQRKSRAVPPFLPRRLADPLADLTPNKESLRGCFLLWGCLFKNNRTDIL